MTEKKFKQVCKCEHCGSEAEMMITGTLEEELPQQAAPAVVSEAEGRTKGHSVCSHCGNEADMGKNSEPNYFRLIVDIRNKMAQQRNFAY